MDKKYRQKNTSWRRLLGTGDQCSSPTGSAVGKIVRVKVRCLVLLGLAWSIPTRGSSRSELGTPQCNVTSAGYYNLDRSKTTAAFRCFGRP